MLFLRTPGLGRVKKKWDGHRSDCRHEKNRTNSRYSGHIWNLKDKNKNFETEWKLIDRASTFNPITRKCRVCLKEKFYIMYHRDGSTLNKRHEIFNTCRHKNWKLLAKVKTWVLCYYLISFWYWKVSLMLSNIYQSW